MHLNALSPFYGAEDEPPYRSSPNSPLTRPEETFIRTESEVGLTIPALDRDQCRIYTPITQSSVWLVTPPQRATRAARTKRAGTDDSWECTVSLDQMDETRKIRSKETVGNVGFFIENGFLKRKLRPHAQNKASRN